MCISALAALLRRSGMECSSDTVAWIRTLLTLVESAWASRAPTTGRQALMRSLFQRSVEAAVCEAVDFLLEQQDRDGFWREFDLQPGASEAWTTAWVGWCLCRMVLRERAQRARIRESCRRAAAALRDSRIVGGWGYNRRAGPDADTTSWVLRFLSACGFNIEPIVYLGPHVDSGGGVHTFREL